MQRHLFPLAPRSDVLRCASLLRKPRTGMPWQVRLSCCTSSAQEALYQVISTSSSTFLKHRDAARRLRDGPRAQPRSCDGASSPRSQTQ